LQDHSRRPQHSPAQTDPQIEQRIVQTHDRFHWGASKIHAYLNRQGDRELPSVTTVHAILKRQNRIGPTEKTAEPLQPFERPAPNDLWQLDFKGALEVQRSKVHPLSILDDHSRYLLRLVGCPNLRHETAWQLLWDLFGEVGLPQALLCDNYFNTRGGIGVGLSWFDGQLLRLGIRPIHGRSYHPQTQGKVERFHGTLKRELWPSLQTTTLDDLNRQFEQWRTEVYNTLRPHEALAQQPPITRWKPSPRCRPERLPELEYPAGSLLRRIQPPGCISYRSCRLLVGTGLQGQYVRLQEQEGHLTVFYGAYAVRHIALDQLKAHITI
jgi:transposase InsO family protein